MKKLSLEKMSTINGGWSRLWWVPYYVTWQLMDYIIETANDEDGNIINIEDNLT